MTRKLENAVTSAELKERFRHEYPHLDASSLANVRVIERFTGPNPMAGKCLVSTRRERTRCYVEPPTDTFSRWLVKGCKGWVTNPSVPGRAVYLYTAAKGDPDVAAVYQPVTRTGRGHRRFCSPDQIVDAVAELLFNDSRVWYQTV